MVALKKVVNKRVIRRVRILREKRELTSFFQWQFCKKNLGKIIEIKDRQKILLSNKYEKTILIEEERRFLFSQRMFASEWERVFVSIGKLAKERKLSSLSQGRKRKFAWERFLFISLKICSLFCAQFYKCGNSLREFLFWHNFCTSSFLNCNQASKPALDNNSSM